MHHANEDYLRNVGSLQKKKARKLQIKMKKLKLKTCQRERKYFNPPSFLLFIIPLHWIIFSLSLFGSYSLENSAAPTCKQLSIVMVVHHKNKNKL